jgi:hypothetical protein
MSWTYYTPKGAAIKILSRTPPDGFILTAATFAVTDTVRIFGVYFITAIQERYTPIARPQIVPIGPKLEVNLSKYQGTGM